ncbi:hypothetical protein [Paenibacillus gorillae]|uniref:hypothetical protein n=1 Tax=Paenibacillus gorillae TaxID=1243662 RepID=UPI0005A837C9|nr:hypothetical protein [Paenibacillus gorillae]
MKVAESEIEELIVDDGEKRKVDLSLINENIKNLLLSHSKEWLFLLPMKGGINDIKRIFLLQITGNNYSN